MSTRPGAAAAERCVSTDLQPAVAGFELSPQQRRLWALAGGRESPAYRSVCAVEVSGPLAVSALAAAFGQVSRRHEILRTTFRRLPGMQLPLQVIAPDAPPRLLVHDLRGLCRRALRREVESILAGLGRQPPGRERGPLLDSCLLQLGAERRLLALGLPALCADAEALARVACDALRFSLGEPPDGEPLQYADSAAWANDLLSSPDTQAGPRYWDEAVAAAGAAWSPQPRPPIARRVTPGADFAPRRRELRLPPGLLAEASRRARSFGATLADLLLGLWQLLLERLAGAGGGLVGYACNGRTLRELADTVGPLERFVPLPPAWPRAGLLADLVAAAQRGAAERRQWQDYWGWQGLTAAAGPPRFLPHCFELHELPALPRGDQVALAWAGSLSCTDRFELKLSARRAGERLQLELHWDAAAYTPAAARRVARWYTALLRDAVARPDAALAELRMLPAGERLQLWAASRPGPVALGPDATLASLFAQQAAQTPERVALTCGGTHLTYGGLAAAVRRLAGRLRRRGVAPEVRVALCLPRSPEMVVGLLAILAAGGAWVPLDPDYPVERRQLMLRDSGAALLLTHRRLRDGVAGDIAAVLCVDDLAPDPEDEAGAPEAAPRRGAGSELAGDASPEHLAYLIYTSGSTGQPKGVMIDHRAIVNRLRWMQRDFPLRDGDRLLQKTPYSFDAAIWELFLPLLTGARLVLAEPGEHRDPSLLLAAVAREQVTVLQLVPSQLAPLLEEEGAAASCASLRRLFCGGEALPKEAAGRFLSRIPASLCNLYGPTEAAIDATCEAWSGEAAAAAGPTVPIGRPIANVEVYLADPQGALVPPGLPGEICIGGAGLARGYLGRPALTAARFVPHPFSRRGGERLYHTGDLARHLPGGRLEFLGRTDAQVKIRGFRIEPGEIEAALLAHPAVHEAAVVVREDAAGERRLIAYVAGGEPAAPPGAADAAAPAAPTGLAATPPAAGDLRRFLAARLPDFMVPAAVVALAVLPRMPSGKLDRAALPAPEARPGAASAQARPQGPAEELLAAIFCEVLGVERFGVHEDFFAAGGHSLSATRVVSRARQALGSELRLRDLFENPTVRRFAGAAAAKRDGRQGPAVPPLVRVARDRPLPLSYAQQRLWFLQQLEPESPAYNLPGSLRLSGPLDVRALAGALSAIVRRHEALRTSFLPQAGEPVQVIHPPRRLQLPIADLSALPRAAAGAAVERLGREEARRPFDLACGCLIRLVLLRLDAREHALLFNLHHVISDGWSSGILARELGALYQALAAGGAATLPELPVQYGDYACWQRQWLQGEALARLLAYWKQRLAGAPAVLQLPIDRPRPAIATYRGDGCVRVLDAAFTGRLSQLARSASATAYMTLLAGWQALLGRCGAGDDVVVGTDVANRDRAEIEGLIGFFVNALVLRTDLAGDPTVGELLARVRETVLGAFAHQDMPFDRLVEELQPRRDLSVTPLYQVVFDMNHADPRAVLDLPGLRLAVVDLPSATAKFDLTLTATETADGLALTLEYATDVVDPATAAALLGHLEALLDSMAGAPSERLGELALLRPPELAQLLAAARGEVRSYPDLTLHELFARQAASTPERVAAVAGEERLSYGELDRRAHRLAQLLCRLGASPGRFVGIYRERDVGFLIAVLAVLRSGAAYVPFDPVYPQERVRWMIADSGIVTLITRAELRDGLDATGCGAELRHVVCLDGAAPEAGAWPPAPEPLRPASGPADPAYMLYTSGSTGAPKAAVVRHDGAVNHIYGQVAALGLDAGICFLQSAPASSDISVWQFLAPLVLGGRTVIVDAETVAAPERLLACLQREAITLVELVPAVLRALLEHAGRLPAAERALPALGWMMATGETVPVELIEAWFRTYPGIRAANAYGPTEASDDVTQLLLDGPPPAGTRSLPIGRPLANFACYVLDRRLRLVPARVPGELAIGGVGVGAGYWRNPAKTAESFVPDPFARGPGAVMYRTGDLARWLPDGNLEFLGRLDHQVKVRGYRIELGEIEAALAAHPQVRECAATVREETGGARLAAYLVAAPGARPAPGELRAFLGQRLPEPLVPSVFVVLDALPRTANGKVDRRRLPAPGPPPGEAQAEVAPRTAAEVTLAEIWSEVLGRDAVSVEGDFFELGGHSLLAMRVVSRIRTAFDVELPLRSIFQHPTVAQLAAAVEAARREARRAALPAIRRVSRTPERLNEPAPPPAPRRRQPRETA
jgi:amino acid adenylation domain-containing protein